MRLGTELLRKLSVVLLAIVLLVLAIAIIKPIIKMIILFAAALIVLRVLAGMLL